ncbi:MAG: squalene/phytoene synthase family protein [Allosphingosinicella sp.]|uniref:squalene/phytoene synthase family protein n=1 Tax=Allosphingosinicella sp. TaxID=2823234 RepID=UPI003939DB3A
MMEFDHDRRLALTYVPAARRAAVEALWRLDLAFASVLSTGREPMISQIRLAWWREALEKLDRDGAPGEPVLQALASKVVGNGVGGEELSRMEEGWTILLSPDPLEPEALARYAAARGGLLFRYTARLLGGESDASIERGGEAWALIDLARHSANAVDRAAAVQAARERSHGGRWPARLRPAGMLAMLAARDAERGTEGWEEPGAPRRMLRMLQHRLTGF